MITNSVGLTQYLLLSTFIFSIGIFGVLTKKHLISVLFSVELMLNAVNINLVAFNKFLPEVLITGQIFALFIIVVAAAEVAIGLAMAIAVFKGKSKLVLEDFNLLKH
jgi:NADH:ubiquinone oxidoreductase subunit K